MDVNAIMPEGARPGVLGSASREMLVHQLY